MPTYQNPGGNSVTYSGVVFWPQRDTAVDFFVPHEELGFNLVSAKPPVKSPILFSGTVTNDTLELPQLSRITVSVVAYENSTLYFADDTDGVFVPASTGYTITAAWRVLGRVRVEGSVQIVVERG